MNDTWAGAARKHSWPCELNISAMFLELIKWLTVV